MDIPSHINSLSPNKRALLALNINKQQALYSAQESVASGKRLVAYIVSTAEEPPTISELRRFLVEKLPDYMVPAAFVMLDQLPKTPNGKVDRRALPEPGVARPELDESFVAPQTSIEKKLVEIWAKVLGLEQVGVHDNFFELGGDSILSIQIISKANQVGLHLSPVQIFQYQTIAELARVAGEKRATKTEQGIVTGQLPLIPVQRWFFEKNLSDPGHWNISLLLEILRDVPDSLLEQAMKKLLVHHDALRLRYVNESEWHQTTAEVDQVVPLDRIDLSLFKDEEQMVAVEKKTSEVQASLNLAKGPLMRLVLFDLGVHKTPCLLWVLHHLVCDVVSWRILLEDLQTALKQLSRDEAIKLPAKTTSLKYWAERLTEYAQSEALQGELDYWLSALQGRVAHLPVDYPEGRDANTEASICTVKVSLSAEETQALLQKVPTAYTTQINDVLLTALVQAFSQWTGELSLLIDLEGHGREDIFEDVDLSRTVGWFTTFFPVLLSLGETENPGDALRSIKEQLRRIPNRGIGYGLLRYLSEDALTVSKIRDLPRPEVNFNYLGQFDQALRDSPLFGLVQETNISDRSPRGNRSHLLEIVGSVIGGRLQVEWSYSENAHQRATIKDLAQGFVEKLRSLIIHSQSAGTGGHTPSDFAEFQWDQAELDNISAAILKSKGAV